MIDAPHFSPLPNEIWVPGWVSVLGEQYRQVTIPKDANMLWFTAISAGGGGARPNVGAATAGGGGGACGNVTHLIIPASVIPKVLWAHVGLGGAGATANNTAGTNGIGTFLSCLPNANDEDSLMIVNPGTGGSAAGTGGTVGSASVITAMDMATNGTWIAYSGQAGGAGTATNGTAVAVATSIFISAGAGGGGSSGGTGGDQTSASALYPTISGGATGDNPGANGIMVNRPLICIGGAGGGGINGAGTGANRGGDGAGYGSGGGGGGNAASGVSGNGGNGAPGLLIMRWW